MKVYELKINGKKIICPTAEELAGWIAADVMGMDDTDEPMTITVSKVKMTEDEFENLPEFTGY